MVYLYTNAFGSKLNTVRYNINCKVENIWVQWDVIILLSKSVRVVVFYLALPNLSPYKKICDASENQNQRHWSTKLTCKLLHNTRYPPKFIFLFFLFMSSMKCYFTKIK